MVTKVRLVRNERREWRKISIKEKKRARKSKRKKGR